MKIVVPRAEREISDNYPNADIGHVSSDINRCFIGGGQKEAVAPARPVRFRIGDPHLCRSVKNQAPMHWNSAASAMASAVIYLLLETAKANSLALYRWLRRVLRDLPAGNRR
ncbi:transposase domain-containing protein [Massilia sp. CCM 8734]|uniref:transposase domain-containing protein n=1 Tax=Massilia sp. CCM 8734 TaxID=2609283 RepID=UPI00141F1780|nr:transposase domain-containing protein [Massilia sp. CCM 8734]NHZ99363.1 hypothetical protein [Massilia sp. CCM 8734]